MKKLHFSININAPKQMVWDTMLADKTYRLWTAEFSPGSRFEGSWDKGADIRFLGEGQGGMVAQIAENKPAEFLSIQHLGMIDEHGQVDTQSEAVKAWIPAFENYLFREIDGVTTLEIEIDSNEEFEAMFTEAWPKALEKLKQICEE